MSDNKLAKTESYVSVRQIIRLSYKNMGSVLSMAGIILSIAMAATVSYWIILLTIVLVLYLVWHQFNEWKEQNDLIGARFLDFVKESWYDPQIAGFIPDKLAPELKIPKYLVHANLPNPDNMPEMSPDAVVAHFGNCVGFTSGAILTIISIGGEPFLTAKQTNRGLLINLELFDKRGSKLATIVDNKFLGKVTDDLEIQSSDSSTIDIFDKNDDYRLIFHIRYLNPKAIEILGVMYHPKLPSPLIIDENGITIFGSRVSNMCLSVSGGSCFDINP
jgi:hypothetical protein